MNAASERRMVGMLERVGLDPAIAEISDPDTIVEFSIKAVMEEIRQRCRACPNVNVCERWLATKIVTMSFVPTQEYLRN